MLRHLAGTGEKNRIGFVLFAHTVLFMHFYAFLCIFPRPISGWFLGGRLKQGLALALGKRGEKADETI